MIENPTPDVLSALLDFLERKFGFWLVVLKTLDPWLDSTFHAMRAIAEWLHKV